MVATQPAPRQILFGKAVVRIVRFLARPNTYTTILGLLLVFLLVGTVLVWWFEQEPTGEPQMRDVNNAFVFMVQNVTGVGIGAIPPKTMWARATGVFFVILAAGLRALFVAAVVSGFVNRLILQGKGLRRVNMEGHVIISGWNSRVKEIVNVLDREAFGSGSPVVLLANLKEHPLQETPVKFISGDPMSEVDLDRAGVKTARSAIVLADESDGSPHMDSTYDARSVLAVLAVKAANPQLHVVAQVRDPANRHHFERAHADEIVASAEMSEGVLARAAVNQGIARVYSDLLRRDKVPEMFVIDAAPAHVGKTFQAVLVDTNVRDQRILLGLVQDDVVSLCPPPDSKISPTTKLVLLGNVTRNGRH